MNCLRFLRERRGKSPTCSPTVPAKLALIEKAALALLLSGVSCFSHPARLLSLRRLRRTVAVALRLASKSGSWTFHPILNTDCSRTCTAMNSGQAFADHMTAVSSQYYGTAAPVFIEKLLTEPDKGKSRADSICQKFLESIPDAHGQVARVAHRFAIVAAAGEIGMRHSILPWPDDAAIDGVHACFKSWFEAWGGPGAIELRAGIDQVRAFFELHGEFRFEPFYGSADRPVHNRAGFRKTAEEACEWFVLPKVWREEVCRGFDMVNLNRELIRLKILIPGDGNKASSPHKIAALGSVVKRLYHITDAVIEGDTGLRILDALNPKNRCYGVTKEKKGQKAKQKQRTNR